MNNCTIFPFNVNKLVTYAAIKRSVELIRAPVGPRGIIKNIALYVGTKRVQCVNYWTFQPLLPTVNPNYNEN